MLAAMADRRQALRVFFAGAAGSLAVAACAPSTPAPPAASSRRRVPVDFADPAQNLRSFIRLTGDLDSQAETVGWFGGTVFAVSGHLLYRCFMNRTGTAERLPAALRQRTEQRYPEFFRAPGDDTWGGPNDSSFSVYMAEHAPKPAG